MAINSPKIIVFRLLLVLALIVIAWRVLVTGMSGYYVDKAGEGDEKALDKALSWNPANTDALYLKGWELRSSAPERAIELLQAAIRGNPADARPLVALVSILQEKGNPELADRMMAEAVKRMPANKSIRLRAANYWVSRNQLDKAVADWNAVLLLDAGMGRQVYPLLMQLAESQQARGLLKPLADDPPDWWDGFFRYLAAETKQLDTVIAVATLRHQSGVPLSTAERQQFVIRLKKDNQWAEAYLVWLNGLGPEQRRYLGSVFDGGFELEPSNDGFGWYFPKVKGVIARPQHSYGIDGLKALRLTFQDQEFQFRHLYQPLFLSPGEHEFHVRTRVDSLSTRGGLRWVVRCAEYEELLLGESDRLVGASEWQLMTFRFEVPDTPECAGQVLRLESVGKTTFDHKLKGEVWFDRLAIRSLPGS